MNIKTILLLALLAGTVSLTSCKKDKEDPTIVVAEPADHDHFIWGQQIHVEATFADDKGLKEYEVFIGDANQNMDMDFNFHHHGDIEGVENEFHEHVTVPDSCASMAYIYFNVTDAEDKTASKSVMIHLDPQ